ncbi:MAG: hypothetical protein QM703_20455 [Gemmatales bacterium]
MRTNRTSWYFTAPFPGNVYGAFRIARAMKKYAKKTKLILGGGYVNTELRELSDPRVFDYFDYITLDDGEAPMLALLEHLKNKKKPLLRTFVRKADSVELVTTETLHDVPIVAAGTPSYWGLPLQRYVSLFEMLNPMHRLWSDGRWNKLTIAHGCYWKQCSFCDVSLDYIGRYERAPADLAREPHRAARRGDGPDRVSLCRRSRTTGCVACARRAPDRARRHDHLVGQRSLRESVHARAVRTARALGLRGDERWPRGSRRAIAC